jgi:hypothetical protein
MSALDERTHWYDAKYLQDEIRRRQGCCGME